MDRILFVAFLAVLLLAPLPLGSNRPWSWNLLAVLLALITLLGSIGQLRISAPSASLPRFAVIAFLAVCGWVALQASPLMPAAWYHPLWTLDASVAAGAQTGTISLSPDSTLNALVRLLSYGLAFVLAFQFCQQAGRARMLFQVLAVGGLLGAAYGLAAYWGKWETLLFFWPAEYRPAVHGTFINRNHFATWLGLGLLCLLALLFQPQTQRRNPMYRLPVKRDLELERLLLRLWKPLLALVIMTAALVLTHSRGGFIATFVGVLVLLGLLHRRQPLLSRSQGLLLATGLTLLLLTFLASSRLLLQRFDRSVGDLDGRFHAFGLSSQAMADNPWLGFGYGTFADSFRLYRDEALREFFDKAHNTYIESAFELGWPSAMLLVLAVASLVSLCFKGVWRRRRDWVFPAAAVAATALVGVHALIDFSLQLPAVAVTYAVMLGAGCAQARSTARTGQRPVPSRAHVQNSRLRLRDDP